MTTPLGSAPTFSLARTRIGRCHTSYIEIATPLCAARLRDGSSCRSVPASGDLCEHHARLAADPGRDTVVSGDYPKRRSARERIPVNAESEPLELRSHASERPSAVRPALALTAAEEVETIRRVLLEAAIARRPRDRKDRDLRRLPGERVRRRADLSGAVHRGDGGGVALTSNPARAPLARSTCASPVPAPPPGSSA